MDMLYVGCAIVTRSLALEEIITINVCTNCNIAIGIGKFCSHCGTAATQIVKTVPRYYLSITDYVSKELSEKYRFALKRSEEYVYLYPDTFADGKMVLVNEYIDDIGDLYGESYPIPPDLKSIYDAFEEKYDEVLKSIPQDWEIRYVVLT